MSCRDCLCAALLGCYCFFHFAFIALSGFAGILLFCIGLDKQIKSNQEENSNPTIHSNKRPLRYIKMLHNTSLISVKYQVVWIIVSFSYSNDESWKSAWPIGGALLLIDVFLVTLTICCCRYGCCWNCKQEDWQQVSYFKHFIIDLIFLGKFKYWYCSKNDFLY